MVHSDRLQQRQRPRQPAYDMTRAGFVLLVMGWTGAKALDFKIAYMEFDRMEEALLTGQLNPVSAARGRQIAREP